MVRDPRVIGVFMKEVLTPVDSKYTDGVHSVTPDSLFVSPSHRRWAVVPRVEGPFSVGTTGVDSRTWFTKRNKKIK